jgi:hypothetical protein
MLVDKYQSGDTVVHACKNTVFPFKFYIKKNSGNAKLLNEVNRGTVIFYAQDKKSYYACSMMVRTRKVFWRKIISPLN